jgi:hypothetical protein
MDAKDRYVVEGIGESSSLTFLLALRALLAQHPELLSPLDSLANLQRTGPCATNLRDRIPNDYHKCRHRSFSVLVFGFFFLRDVEHYPRNHDPYY